MSEFDIGIGYLGCVPEEAVDDFVAAVEAPGLVLRTQRRESEVQASVEWLVPTAVVVLLATGYLNGFLSEMGKDHYRLLKAAAISLGKRLLGPSGPEVLLVSAGGERSTGQRFSIVYSIEAQTDDRRVIKLLFPKAATETELADAVEAFTDLLLDRDRVSDIIREHERLDLGPHRVLTWFDRVSRQIEVVDPVPPGVRRGSRS